MVFQSQISISLLNLVETGVLRNAENLVVTALTVRI
jgi:hypothetical protein